MGNQLAGAGLATTASIVMKLSSASEVLWTRGTAGASSASSATASL